MTLLTERYAEQIAGVVSCFDRIVIIGTLPGVCYAEGMAKYLRLHGVRLFDYPRFAEPLREEVRANAERLAAEQGLTIEFVRSAGAFRKEDRVQAVLRIETTVNDVSFFRHHRKVEHRTGTTETKLAPMRKTIYSLAPLREVLLAANRRYLAFLSDLTDPSAGSRQAERLAEPVRQEDRSYRGFNLLSAADLALFVALTRGEWRISGFRNATLRRLLPGRSGAPVSRLLKRLHLHGLIRKSGRTYKYYLTPTGQRVILTALKVRELVVVPSLAGLLPAA